MLQQKRLLALEKETQLQKKVLKVKRNVRIYFPFLFHCLTTAYEDFIEDCLSEIMEKTIVKFALPYAILTDDNYEVSLNGEISKLSIKSRQNVESLRNIGKMNFTSSGGGSASISHDRHGIANYTEITIEFPFDFDLSEHMPNPMPIDPMKEKSIQHVNRVIEVVRQLTNQYWIERIKPQDIISLEFIRFDKNGKELHGFSSDFGKGPSSIILEKSQESMKKEIDNALLNEAEIKLSNTLLFDSLNFFDKGNFNESVILANISLEVLISENLFKKFCKEGLSEDEASSRISSLFSRGKKQKKEGLHRLLSIDFKEIGKKSLESYPDLWEKFLKTRTQRKNVIHPKTTKLDEKSARETILNIIEIGTWIVSNSDVVEDSS